VDTGGGPAAADAICQADAGTAGLPNATNYQALITTDTAAIGRFDLTPGPWFRLDGAQVVATAADLGAAAGDRMLTTINLDPAGNYYANFNAWTGSGVSPGVTTATANCTNWTVAGGTATGWAGLVNLTGLFGPQWLSWPTTCNRAARRRLCIVSRNNGERNGSIRNGTRTGMTGASLISMLRTWVVAPEAAGRYGCADTLTIAEGTSG